MPRKGWRSWLKNHRAVLVINPRLLSLKGYGAFKCQRCADLDAQWLGKTLEGNASGGKLTIAQTGSSPNGAKQITSLCVVKKR